MFPLKDETPRKSFPFVNYLIIAFTFFVFLWQISVPDFETFIFSYGFVPARFNLFDLNTYQYIFYSIFLHGGWFHLTSNMWFLHIFGDNVEDKLGHLKYFFFYLVGGFAAVFFQLIFNLSSNVPMIGASGAVSAVAGSYFVLFKQRKIKAIVPDFFGFWHIAKLPAWFFLGYWFLIQIFSGIGSLVSFDINRGGVAWFAHIGGFLFGWWFGR